MFERHRFAQDVLSGQWTMTELCARYGISRNTGYKWRERFLSIGVRDLEEHSRAPLSSPNEPPQATIDLILAEHSRYGWGARKILKRLQSTHPLLDLPARSTIFDPCAKRSRAAPTLAYALEAPRRRTAADDGAEPSMDQRLQRAIPYARRRVPLPVDDRGSFQSLTAVLSKLPRREGAGRTPRAAAAVSNPRAAGRQSQRQRRALRVERHSRIESPQRVAVATGHRPSAHYAR